MTRTSTRWLFLLVTLVALAGTLACPQGGYVWLEAGSTRDHLVVLRGNSRDEPGRLHLAGAVIRSCPSNVPGDPQVVFWKFERAPGVQGIEPPSRIVYGVLPDGYVESAPAAPLTGDCIVVYAGPRFITVRFASDGKAWIDS